MKSISDEATGGRIFQKFSKLLAYIAHKSIARTQSTANCLNDVYVTINIPIPSGPAFLINRQAIISPGAIPRVFTYCGEWMVFIFDDGVMHRCRRECVAWRGPAMPQTDRHN